MNTYYEQIHPCRTFQFFIVLIDASMHWFYVILLYSPNFLFKYHHIMSTSPYYLIKSSKFDNVGEFVTQSFNNYCLKIKINVEYLLAHTHTYNDLTDSFINHPKFIARSLILEIQNYFLLLGAWNYAYSNLDLGSAIYKSYVVFIINLYVIKTKVKIRISKKKI